MLIEGLAQALPLLNLIDIQSNFNLVLIPLFLFGYDKGPKVLDLDLMNDVATEGGNSEMSLKVDLHHFGEVCMRS